MDFGYSQENNEFVIDGISIYAPPAGKDIIMANFAPKIQTGGIGINMNFGIDIGTQEHSSLSAIEANPNALQMLDIATSDLSQAQILGDCMIAVSKDSKRIPCCNSTSLSNTNEKSM